MMGATETGNRLQRRIEALRARGEGALMPFVVIGDPDLETSMAIVDALVEGGADALELGFPFSDPPADGPVIQAADVRALKAGVTPAAAMDFLAEVKRRHDIPVGLLIYHNLMLQMGLEAFYERAAQVGVDAVLAADVPLEEAEGLIGAARAHQVAPVFIASELTRQARLERIGQVATEGYLYAVARVGITGEQAALAASLPEALTRFKSAVSVPVMAGFGISTPDHARAVMAAGADGVICGSAIVRRIAENLDDKTAMLAAVRDFTRTMKAAIV